MEVDKAKIYQVLKIVEYAENYGSRLSRLRDFYGLEDVAEVCLYELLYIEKTNKDNQGYISVVLTPQGADFIGLYESLLKMIGWEYPIKRLEEKTVETFLLDGDKD